jgi:hypothetical protein
MNIAFVDLEFWTLYGSYRRDFIPIELGILIYNPVKDEIVIKGAKFRCDVELVLRKNLINEYGKIIGVNEKVANLEKQQYNKPYDKTYKLTSPEKKCLREKCTKNYYLLKAHLSKTFHEFNVTEIIFFGKTEDINQIKKSRFNLSDFNVLDMQEEVKKYTDTLFSLDKLSIIVKFKSDRVFFSSENFNYKIPKKYVHLIKPHRAVGDVARIFLIYREFFYNLDSFVEKCSEFISQTKNLHSK